MLRRLGALYLRANERSPVLTQCASAGIIATAGDMSMQLLERRNRASKTSTDMSPTPSTIEWERTGRLAAYRATMFAPAYVLWLRLMERVIGTSGLGVVLKKVVLDQALWTPPSMCVLYGWMGLAEHAQERVAAAGGVVAALQATGGVSDAARDGIAVLRAGLDQGVERARECLWPTLRVNWPVWGVVGIVTFGFVPLHLRVIWVSTNPRPEY